jgi:hypothetical protein
MFKNLVEKFDKMMMAVTFAEAGEHDKALDIAYRRTEKANQRKLRKEVQEENRPRLYS